jgi:hypothetical protein
LRWRKRRKTVNCRYFAWTWHGCYVWMFMCISRWFSSCRSFLVDFLGHNLFVMFNGDNFNDFCRNFWTNKFENYY